MLKISFEGFFFEKRHGRSRHKPYSSGHEDGNRLSEMERRVMFNLEAGVPDLTPTLVAPSV
jgi:hypothetical protein